MRSPSKGNDETPETYQVSRGMEKESQGVEDVIIKWLGEHEDFEGAPTERMLPTVDELAETQEVDIRDLRDVLDQL